MNHDTQQIRGTVTSDDVAKLFTRDDGIDVRTQDWYPRLRREATGDELSIALQGLDYTALIKKASHKSHILHGINDYLSRAYDSDVGYSTTSKKKLAEALRLNIASINGYVAILVSLGLWAYIPATTYRPNSYIPLIIDGATELYFQMLDRQSVREETRASFQSDRERFLANANWIERSGCLKRFPFVDIKPEHCDHINVLTSIRRREVGMTDGMAEKLAEYLVNEIVGAYENDYKIVPHHLSELAFKPTVDDLASLTLRTWIPDPKPVAKVFDFPKQTRSKAKNTPFTFMPLLNGSNEE